MAKSSNKNLEMFQQLASLLDDSSKIRQEFFDNKPQVVVFFTHLFSIIESLTLEFEQ